MSEISYFIFSPKYPYSPNDIRYFTASQIQNKIGDREVAKSLVLNLAKIYKTLYLI